MWHFTRISYIFFLCIFVVADKDAFHNIFHILGKNDVNLGAYDVDVKIGDVPDLTNMTDLDKKASSGAVRIAESVRSLFPTGISIIPPLDPYRNRNLEPLVIKPQDSHLVNGQVDIQDVKVEGAKAFKINSVQIRMDTQRTDFDFTIPSLHGYVTFHTNMKLGGVLPVQLDAKVNFNIKGISVVGAVGTAEVAHHGKKVYQVQTMQGKFHANELHISLEGVRETLMQDIFNFLEKSNVLNNIPGVEIIKELINHYVAVEVKEEINKALQGLTVAQVKAYLLG